MLSFLFALILAPAFAAPTSVCSGVGGVVTEVRFQADLNCDLARELSDIFNGMAQRFGEAPSVRLLVGVSSDNASFDNGSVVQVPVQLVFSGTYGREHSVPAASLYAAAAHEYGHAIFHEKVRRHFPQYKDLFAGLAEISDLKWRAEQSVESLRARYSELMENESYQSFMRHLTAYAEFYADTVTVFYFNDKSAMFKALYYGAMTDFQYQYVRMRDFDSEVSVQWEHLLYEDHAKLAYARSYVGKNLWPQDATQVSRFANLIAQEVLRTLGHDIIQQEPTDYLSANEELIRNLSLYISAGHSRFSWILRTQDSVLVDGTTL